VELTYAEFKNHVWEEEATKKKLAPGFIPEIIILFQYKPVWPGPFSTRPIAHFFSVSITNRKKQMIKPIIYS
jgi:hypothetical protein